MASSTAYTRHDRRESKMPNRSGILRAVLALTLSSCILLSASSATSAISNPNANNFLPFNQPLQSSDQRGASLLEEVLSADVEHDQICRPTGQIADACCDFETVEKSLNTPRFFKTLDELVKTNYFRYYKVDLYKDCPFWVDNGLCMNRACTVEKASEDEIPEEYRASTLSDVRTADESEIIFHTEHASSTGPGQANDSCHCRSSDFCHWDDENLSSDASWVDLIKNPERFTGYAGPGANRVWKAIYEENCFGAVPKGSFLEPPRDKRSGGTGFVSRADLLGGSASGNSDSGSSSNPLLGGGGGFPGLISSIQAPEDPAAHEQCLEKRVFYRVISGLHASISTHICSEYLDQGTGEWSPNLECFISRISQHPERLQNVYFNYVLLVRALSRAGEYLNAFNLKRGHKIPTSEQKTLSLLESLVSQATSNPPTFNEASMFHPSNPEAPQLREEFKNHFRNISSIMDCVGCDKCRLWGKMQVNGLGTAMKILFSEQDTVNLKLQEATPFDPDENPAPELERSELVALINTLHRFAESLKAVETFREMYQKEKQSLKNKDGSEESKGVLYSGTKQSYAPANTKKPAQQAPQTDSASGISASKPPAPLESNHTQGSIFGQEPHLHAHWQKILATYNSLAATLHQKARSWLGSISGYQHTEL
ncbi:unnamed protein product [Sympodiomycopsis kandeliae]